MRRQQELTKRANGVAATQYVSETHDHKPDARGAPPPGISYSTNGGRHTRNHPEAALAAPPARHIPASVNIWNVESFVSMRINDLTKQAVLRLNRELWESIGRPLRVNVTGSPDKGFVIAWGERFSCQVEKGRYSTKRSPHIFVTATHIGLPVEARGPHVIRACSRGGQIEIAAPHPLWLAGDPAFVEEVRTTRDPRSGVVIIAKRPGPTTPVPKERPAALPAPTAVDLLKATLKGALANVAELKAELERRTGLRFKFVGNSKGGLDIKIDM